MTQASTEYTNTSAKHKSDILLNNFQIKKKRYRVLLNCDHIVWERLDAKRNNEAEKNEKATEVETEQLSNRATYGSGTSKVHLDEIVRVAKGNTKSATLRNVVPQSATDLDCNGTQNAEGNSAAPQPSTQPPTEQYLVVHFAERVVKSEKDCNRWRVRILTLFNNDAYIIKQWHALLSKLLKDSVHSRVQRLLVFINPYGGRKQGLQVYERYCKPLFELAGIDASCIISQRANQIRDMLTSHDLSPFDAVCCVGGDGTVAEVINGLIFRAIRDLGMDPRRPEYVPKPELPFAIIPAGSTDTIAYSLHGTADVKTAAIHLILGQRRGMDISSVKNGDGIIRFCASVLSYGYLGDVAAKSEKYRWMGTKRYEYTGVKAFLRNRGYDAELRILQNATPPAIDDEAPTGSRAAIDAVDGVAATAPTCCYANCRHCLAAAELAESQRMLLQKSSISCETDGEDEVDDEELPNLSKLLLYSSSQEDMAVNIANHVQNESVKVDNISNVNLADCDKNTKAQVMHGTQVKKETQIKALLAEAPQHASLDGPATADHRNKLEVQSSLSCCSTTSMNNNFSAKLRNEKLATKWHTVAGQFFMISGANISCACSRSPHGIARNSHLGDGNLDLILVRKTSLLNNVRFLIHTMGRNGDIRSLPFVEVYRTQRFSFRTQYSDEENSVRGSCQPIVESTSDNEIAENVSRWNCDGEVVNDLDITMSSHCQLIDVFMRGPYAFKKEDNEEKSSNLCCCK